MAITATSLTASSSTANAATYATASISPTTGRVLLAFVSMTGIGAAVATTITGLSGTWTNIGGSYLPTSLGAGSYDCAALYCTNYTGTGTLTLGNTDSATACVWDVIEIDGANTTTPIVTAATKKVDLGASVSTPTLTLDSPADSTNRAFVGFTAVSSSATIAAARTSWTELAEVAQSTPSINLQCQWRSDTFETTAGVTYTGGPFAAAAVAVEVAAAGATFLPAAPTVINQAALIRSYNW